MVFNNPQIFFQEIYNSNDSKKIICFDYGIKKTGVAISDELMILATPFDVLYQKTNNQIIEYIINSQINNIVFGMPLDMNKKIHIHGNDILEMCKFLDKFRILLYDESMTSKNIYQINNNLFKNEASKVHKNSDKAKLIKNITKIHKNIRKNDDDSMVACLILNEILNCNAINFVR